MKQSLLIGSMLATAAFLSLTGCVERRVYVQAPPPPPVVAPPPGEVVVVQPPPAPPPEVIVAAPGPAYVWRPGYWSWQGRWVWVSGAWVARPHPHAVWVPGRWAHRGHGYIWIGGYWR